MSPTIGASPTITLGGGMSLTIDCARAEPCAMRDRLDVGGGAASLHNLRFAGLHSVHPPPARLPRAAPAARGRAFVREARHAAPTPALPRPLGIRGGRGDQHYRRLRDGGRLRLLGEPRGGERRPACAPAPPPFRRGPPAAARRPLRGAPKPRRDPPPPPLPWRAVASLRHGAAQSLCGSPPPAYPHPPPPGLRRGTPPPRAAGARRGDLSLGYAR
jgi:hypothetical protein